MASVDAPVAFVVETALGAPKNEVIDPFALGFLESEVARSPALRLRDMVVLIGGRRKNR